MYLKFFSSLVVNTTLLYQVPAVHVLSSLSMVMCWILIVYTNRVHVQHTVFEIRGFHGLKEHLFVFYTCTCSPFWEIFNCCYYH